MRSSPTAYEIAAARAATTLTIPIKKAKGAELSDEHKQLNWLHARARSRAEQANSLFKMTCKALRRVSLSPNAIGRIVAAALLVLHIKHDRPK